MTGRASGIAALSRRDLERAEREFERIGLLLRHDARMPSFTGLVVGAPFRGSWWAHPRTHEIYDLLQQFHRRSGSLSVKLIDAKVTYVHPRLWPALLGVAGGRAAWQRDGLSRPARALLATVRRRGSVRSDQLSAPAPSERGAAIGELESRLLIHTVSVHTESGTHRKLLRTWSRWLADEGLAVSPLPYARAREELVRAAEPFRRVAPRAVGFPWSRTEPRVRAAASRRGGAAAR
jgi:hypothetical protein